jgi:hypothetical protein
MPNIKMAKRMCATCIFRPGLRYAPIEEFRRRWGRYGHQVCHQFSVKGDGRRGVDVWCRGFFERELPEDERVLFLALPGFVEVVDLPGSKEVV